jgi:hypothetical protein
LDRDECARARFVLCQFSTSIQRAYNRQIARMNWAESNIDIIVDTSQYSGASYNERRIAAIKGNDVARKLYDLKMKAQAAADNLSYIPDKIKFTADTLYDIVRIKQEKLNG